MIEVFEIEEDAFVGSEGHIIYPVPCMNSALMKAEKEKEYSCNCTVYFGSEMVHKGKCDFKLRENKNGSIFIIFRVNEKYLGKTNEKKIVEVEIPGWLI